MKELVGKVITDIYASQCNKYIGFKTTDSMIVYKAINKCSFSFYAWWINKSRKIYFVNKYLNSYRQVTHLHILYDDDMPLSSLTITLENDNNEPGGDFKLMDLVDYKCSFSQLRECIIGMEAIAYGIYNIISIKDGDLEIELLQQDKRK